MNTLARTWFVPPALAALALVFFEIVWTLSTGATALGGFGPGLALAVAIAGLLGLPAWALGLVGVAGWHLTASGWRWGRGEAPAPKPSMKAAWALFALLALGALVIIVQMRTIGFIKAFKRPVYQGLGAGLAAAVTVVFLTALAGPVVGVLARGLEWLEARAPRWAVPTNRVGAGVWALAVALLGAVLAPIVIKALHTVDLRPARLALTWIALLLGASALMIRWRPGRLVTLVVALGIPATLAGGLTWAAGALGESQSRVVALDRDTLLTGRVAAALRQMADRDGDGAPALFAGGDCDDRSAAIRPGVYDVPDDGVDQNCTGGDLKLGADPLKPPKHKAPGERQSWNVLLLTVDALRADALERGDLPKLAAFARDHVNFSAAYSAGASTYWSVAALMTSKMPARVRMGGDQTPVKQETLLTEILQKAGYHTALFANVTVFFVRGLRQGTHTANYDTSHFTVHGAKPGSAHLTDSLLKHVEAWQAKRVRGYRDRFMMWAHYYDPHDPYFEVPGYPAEDGSDEARYRAICRYVDTEIARLLDGLSAKGVLDHTIVILTADHGDEFLDHGHRFHGSTLYDEMVRVPLIMHVPGGVQRQIDNPIGHIELAPTVLDLLGLPIPADHQGRSRAAEILTGEPAPEAPVWFEVLPDRNYKAEQVGVRLGQHKLIYRIDQHAFELFDLKADPAERSNLYDQLQADPLVAEQLKPLLMRYTDHHLFARGQGWSRATKPAGVPDPKKKRK